MLASEFTYERTQSIVGAAIRLNDARRRGAQPAVADRRAETAQRACLLTGQAAHLASYDADAARIGRHGLAGMRHRVESHGGRMDVVSAPGKGTVLAAELPPRAE